jgi:hypothetical protein
MGEENGLREKRTKSGLFSLNSAIDEYRRLDHALTDEIRGQQDEAIVSRLSCRLGVLHKAISDAEPLNDTETLGQIMFFLELAERWTEPSTDLHVAKRLVAKRLASSRLSETGARISLINSDFRYEMTTRGNREFYGLGETGIIGRHVGEVIGKERFEGRARKFLEMTFAGIRQEYYHLLDTVDGQRIMKCTMDPQAGESSALALVTMIDVTEEVENSAGIRLIELKPAA